MESTVKKEKILDYYGKNNCDRCTEILDCNVDKLYDLIFSNDVKWLNELDDIVIADFDANFLMNVAKYYFTKKNMMK